MGEIPVSLSPCQEDNEFCSFNQINTTKKQQYWHFLVVSKAETSNLSTKFELKVFIEPNYAATFIEIVFVSFAFLRVTLISDKFAIFVPNIM